MHPELLDYYNRELQHLREMGGEFARAYPKVAGRLGLDGFECADPYVERLLEGFSFLAARIQLKQDAQFPQFSQQLLDILYPHYLAPTPSMTVLGLQPDLDHPQLSRGVPVPRDTTLLSRRGPHGDTRCRYRTAHSLTLWPLTLISADYAPYDPQRASLPAVHGAPPRAMLHLRFRVHGGCSANQLALDRLPLYLRGSDGLPALLYEHLLAHQCGGWLGAHPVPKLRGLGFDAAQALLPPARRGFDGFRLLQEYFAFPRRFLFIEQTGLQPALNQVEQDEFELLWLFDRHLPRLEQTLNHEHFTLFATPAINLFPLSATHLAFNEHHFEQHIVPDRTRPLDYEVCQVETVHGLCGASHAAQPFTPFYQAHDLQDDKAPGIAHAYYQLRRERRIASAQQQHDGARSHYPGSETYIALVDSQQAPYRKDLRQLRLDLWCSNRDLPLSMPLGSGDTDFTLENELPLHSVRSLTTPSAPLPMRADGQIAWRLINHLTLNYLSLATGDPEGCLAALKTLLALYCPPDDPAAQRQIDGLTGVTTHSVTRRLPTPGPLAFGRGLELTLLFDEAAFEGASAFLLANVLQRFLTQFASLNSFVEVVACSQNRGEIMRWPVMEGTCPTL